MDERNRYLRNQVLTRDLGLCRCCGFKANEVHHIKPLIYGGKDEARNMISLCSFCHKHAPNTKEQFKYYLNRGGAKYEFLLGSCINRCLLDGIDLQTIIPTFRQVVQIFREIEFTNARENINLKKWVEVAIEDINLDEI